MPDANGFSPTHRRILKVLEDEKQHGREEIFSCLYDDLSRPETLWHHMATLRKILRKHGQDVAVIGSGDNVKYLLVKAPPVVDVPQFKSAAS